MKKYLLPSLAVLFAVAAAIVIFAVPKGAADKEVSALGYAERNTDGDVVISASELAAGRLTVLKFSESSNIELIATLDAEGHPYAALGTCQSCMGSPGAYYTQNGDMLQCNNCGLTFPLSVIGTDGAGCHPIMIDENDIQRDQNSLVIDDAVIALYEPLFAMVAEH